MKPPISVVWLKCDLRLTDHAPIEAAIAAGRPCLFLFLLEPEHLAQPTSSNRHWRFAYQCIQDLNTQLRPLSGKVVISNQPALTTFRDIQQHYTIQTLFSHEETGIRWTYDRDKSVAEFCRHERIEWREFQNNGTQRGRKNRRNWSSDWQKTMTAPLLHYDLNALSWAPITPELEHQLHPTPLPLALRTPDPLFQVGGRATGERYLRSFLTDRISRYMQSISKPAGSRVHCSRLSPYLAWGVFSLREIVHQTLQAPLKEEQRNNFRNFRSRLQWNSHFIQKFEMEDRMEFEHLNRGYQLLDKPVFPERVTAWQTARTGVPMVDANLRCVAATGYINFRMRAMVVSMLTLHLWQPWQTGADWLARQFLDFEPGIHYPQFQMQAGVTGINTVRLYNPVKQGFDHDPDATFIKKWLPELAALPTPFAHEPWKMTPMEQQLYGVTLGEHYPEPIVNLENAAREARVKIWEHRKHPTVVSESYRILKRHTLPNRRNP